MALPWPNIFMGLPWPNIFMGLPWPKIFMTLPWPKMLKVPLLSILKFFEKGDNNKSKTYAQVVPKFNILMAHPCSFENINGSPMAKNIYGPPMAKNIHGSLMAKYIY